MKQRHIVLVALLLCLELVACSPGHTGTTEISFLRAGHLWTIDPDGANAFEAVAPQTAVVSDAWSPDHHLLAFRTLDADFAKSKQARQLVAHSPSGIIGDLPSTLNTVGVDGGTPIAIAFSSPEVSYNNPQWNNDGSRLLYRQTPQRFAANPANVQWWIAQNDQPGGIAARPFSGTFSIPSTSYNKQSYLILADGTAGIFTTNLEGTNSVSRSNPLVNHPLSASLERLLWRPAHQNQSFVYAQEAYPFTINSSTPLPVQLVLQNINGNATKLAICTCTQFAWSPDGNALLYHSGTTDTILNIEKQSSFTFSAAAEGVPYWSPDSQFLLMDGSHTLSLLSLVTHKQTLLLTDNSHQASPEPSLPATSALLQPVPNSLWSADSHHFIFLSQQRLNWQGKKLSASGLYTASIDDQGQAQGIPISLATGNISQPGWTYQDPNTSFLY